MNGKPIDRIVERYLIKKEITREKAIRLINEYIEKKNFPKHILSWIDRRRDKRSRGEFFLHLAEGIRKEHSSFLLWIEYMEKQGYKMRWEKYGTDAVGLAFIEKEKDKKKEINKPDYLISIDSSPFFVVDAKNCSRLDMNTFKKTDLKNYAKHNASMIVFMGDADPIEPDLKTFVFYGPNAVKELNKKEGKTYWGFAGGKKAVRVGDNKMKNKDFSFNELKKDKYIDIVDLSIPKAVFRGPLKRIVNGKYNF